MNISMIPNNDVKTIHASQGDTERVWHFVPYANEVIDTSQDESASINSIRGNTLVWNQLIQNGNFADTSVWLRSNLTFSVANNEATIVQSNLNALLYRTGLPTTVGHKYFISMQVKLDTASSGFVVYGLGTYAENAVLKGQSTTNWQTLSKVFTMGSANPQNMYIKDGSVATQTYHLKNVMLIDLTLMGLEATADQFLSYFPLSYYQYDSGSLLSFNGTGIKTVGKNQFNAEAIVTSSGHSSYVYIQDGYLMFSTGDTSTRGFHWDNLNLPCPLYFKGSAKNFATSANAIRISFDLSDGTTDAVSFPTSVPANEEVSFSKVIGASGKKVIRIRNAWTDTKQAGINLSTTQLEFGSVATDFEPYTENTTNLPTETYFPTGMKSAGSVHDELTPTKAITRIGAVDLGMMNWSRLANGLFIGAVSGMAQNASSSDRNKGILSSLYMPSSTLQLNETMANMTMLKNNSSIYIQNTSYTDATSFKTAMNGVYLFYELATPSEQDISEDLTYPVYVNGTEELLPVNGTSPSTTPLDANIQYPDEARDVYFTYKQSEFESRAIAGSMVCKGLEIEGETDENGITIQSTSELTSEAGFFDCKLKLAQGDDVCYSSKFQLHVERRP